MTRNIGYYSEMAYLNLFPALLLLGLEGTLLFGQQAVEQKLEGPCSVQIAGNNNQVFTCKGMDEKLGNQILQIVNRIASSQLDPSAVMAKLDEIQKGVNEIRLNAAPRALDDAAIKRIIEKISPYRGQKATVKFIATDNEANRLATLIHNALTSAGWDVRPPSAAIVFSSAGSVLSGIRVALARETPSGLALLNALGREGLVVQGRIEKAVAPDLINITVFSKP